ncbi:MAG TPA: Gfo/Idh/MocA family oxidoreductase [Geminicoccaceae bacterium]|nr:Gfo/Idh/MocA family oxidoreductase [Geminicoccaceae bacterium]
MTVKVLQVGAGIRGRHWVQFVKDHPDVTCVGLVEPDPAAVEQAKQITGEPAPPVFADLATALDTVEADAVLIVSPSALHAEHTMAALAAGLVVMVEKPFAVTVAEAERVLARAKEAGRPVIVAENYRFWPAERTVRALIEEGRIGRIDNAVMIDRRNMAPETEGPWLAKLEYAQLQEVAIHHFDSLRYFFDRRPESIAVRVWNPDWSGYRHGANTEAQIDLGDVQVQYLGTLRSRRFGFSLQIEGRDGMIWTNRKYVLWRPGGSLWWRPVKNVKVPPGDEKSYPRGGTTGLLDSLRDAVRDGRLAETRGEDNIWTLAMVEAGKLADREQRRVGIREIYAPLS